jgi:hypothetical protein
VPFPRDGCGRGVAGALEQGAERLEVAQALPPVHAPLPLLAHRGDEAHGEQLVERLVGRGEHRPEQLVEVLAVDAAGRRPPGDEDVARLVDGVGDAREAQVAAQQEAVDLGVVLVGVADDERGHRERLVGADEGGDGLQLALARQGDDELAVAGAALPLQPRLPQPLLDDRNQPVPCGHGMTAWGMPLSRWASWMETSLRPRRAET